jgi:hypothetical protein
MEKPKDSKKVNRPIKKWRSSNFELALWSNEREVNGNLVEFKTMSLSRSFKKKDEDIWRNEVINLRRLDLPRVLTLLNEATRDLFLDKHEQN